MTPSRHSESTHIYTNLVSRIRCHIILLTKTCFELRWRAKNSNRIQNRSVYNIANNQDRPTTTLDTEVIYNLHVLVQLQVQ
jgi:hypothetical protein